MDIVTSQHKIISQPSEECMNFIDEPRIYYWKLLNTNTQHQPLSTNTITNTHPSSNIMKLNVNHQKHAIIGVVEHHKHSHAPYDASLINQMQWKNIELYAKS